MKPPLEALLDRVDNKYALVIVAAKRAQALREGDLPMADVDSSNPVSIALEEIGSGKIRHETPPEGIRGRSRSSGDRGGRSPRESAGCQKSRCRARSVPRRSLPFARSARPQREGCRAGLLSKE